eukprot:TRINITY_DN28319_c0_g1_i1.p1 TRINITY_DN28319_c0_g1~~TRINITY_DN28319_c0_g1_i1.p1  ORF type:complete len:420 (-),score=91.43 TRINITY_DN28319_c0_g1_i1:33-1292(-)
MCIRDRRNHLSHVWDQRGVERIEHVRSQLYDQFAQRHGHPPPAPVPVEVVNVPAEHLSMFHSVRAQLEAARQQLDAQATQPRTSTPSPPQAQPPASRSVRERLEKVHQQLQNSVPGPEREAAMRKVAEIERHANAGAAEAAPPPARRAASPLRAGVQTESQPLQPQDLARAPSPKQRIDNLDSAPAQPSHAQTPSQEHSNPEHAPLRAAPFASTPRDTASAPPTASSPAAAPAAPVVPALRGGPFASPEDDPHHPNSSRRQRTVEELNETIARLASPGAASPDSMASSPDQQQQQPAPPPFEQLNQLLLPPAPRLPPVPIPEHAVLAAHPGHHCPPPVVMVSPQASPRKVTPLVAPLLSDRTVHHPPPAAMIFTPRGTGGVLDEAASLQADMNFSSRDGNYRPSQMTINSQGYHTRRFY